MAATYNPALGTDLDWVRLLAGDRDTANAILTDEEIDGLLAAAPNRWIAAAMACDVILARGQGVVSKAVGDLRLEYGGNVESAYRQHAQRLRERGAAETFNASGERQSVFRTL
jgi:hypothetical protein